MSNEIIPTNGNAPAVYDRELVRNTVAQNATDSELDMFLAYASSTGLNPFKKELWFIKTKDYRKNNGDVVPGKVQMMTSNSGFWQIANSHPQFDGCDEPEFGPDLVIKLPQNKQGLDDVTVPQWVKVKAYRKDRGRPQVATAYWQEYAQDLVNSYSKQCSNWCKMPRVMLTKCAESMALRKLFPQELGDLYTVEEMPAEAQYDAAQEQAEERADERKAMHNHLAQQAAKFQEGEYTFEHGSLKGRPLSGLDNGVQLKNHIAKYRAEMAPEAIELCEKKLQELRAEYARKKAEAEAAQEMPAAAPDFAEGCSDLIEGEID
jgi:phage recombination protein Bet